MLFYADPWKDNPFATLYGEYIDSAFIIAWDEVRIIPKNENEYIFYGYCTDISGAYRKYKPDEFSYEPQMIKWEIASVDTEMRQKKEDKWVTVPRYASYGEKYLVNEIKNNPERFDTSNHSLTGSIIFQDSPTVKSLITGVGPKGNKLTETELEQLNDLLGMYHLEPCETKLVKDITPITNLLNKKTEFNSKKGNGYEYRKGSLIKLMNDLGMTVDNNTPLQDILFQLSEWELNNKDISHVLQKLIEVLIK